jgi:hypothetical protein
VRRAPRQGAGGRARRAALRVIHEWQLVAWTAPAGEAALVQGRAEHGLDALGRHEQRLGVLRSGGSRRVTARALRRSSAPDQA